MKILYVGAMVPAKYSLEIKNSSLAGNKLQNNVIEELRKKADVDVLSFICVSLTSEQKQKIANYNLESSDNYYYKDKNIFKSLISFRKKIKKIASNYDCVMTFNVYYPWLNLPKLCKKTKSLLILSDYSEPNCVKGIAQKIYSVLCRNNFKKYSYIIGLSKNHLHYVTNNQKFLYMPGGIKEIKTPNKIEKDLSKFTIMYSGFLGKVTGIDLLIEAFEDPTFDNYNLIITGRGEMDEFVKMHQKDNIFYYGSLDEQEYINTLNSANILVNPRNMNELENQNNFPSKIFDYLYSGNVVVSTKFPGYEDFIDNFYFCESTVDDIKKVLKQAIDEYLEKKDYFYQKNIEKAKNFFWSVQIEKIIKMIQGDNNEQR